DEWTSLDRSAAIGDIRARRSVRERTGQVNKADAKDFSAAGWWKRAVPTGGGRRCRPGGASLAREERGRAPGIRPGWESSANVEGNDGADPHRHGNEAQAAASLTEGVAPAR